MSHAAIVLAAGYGSLRGPSGQGPSKLLELVDEEPMIVRVVRTAMDAGLNPCVVVVNPIYGHAIQKTLFRYLPSRPQGCQYFLVRQPAGYGTGDATHRAARILGSVNVEHCTVLCGDMPLWRAETVRALSKLHRSGTTPLTMASYRLPPEDQTQAEWFKRFGRVLRNHAGAITHVVEARNLLPYQLAGITTVNPALMAFQVPWLLANLPKLTPHEQSNGYPAETYLPELVECAYRDGGVAELALSDPTELLGVNTQEELEHVRELAQTAPQLQEGHNEQAASASRTRRTSLDLR